MTAVTPGGSAPAPRGAWLAPQPEPAGRRRDSRRTPSVVTLVFVVGVMVTLLGLAVTMQSTQYDTWGAFLIGVWDPLESTCRHASLSIL